MSGNVAGTLTEDTGPRSGGRTAFAFAVASGKKITEACTAAGVEPRTGTRWLKEPAVKAEIRRLRALMVGEAVGLAAGSMAKAMQTLARLLDDPNPLVRMHAARIVVQSGGRLWETSDLAEQVEEIKAKLGMGEGAAG